MFGPWEIDFTNPGRYKTLGLKKVKLLDTLKPDTTN